MSGTLKDKLLGHEVPPPQAVWDVIAAELDSNAIGSRFTTVLQNAEIIPPAAAWTHIKTGLDNNFFSTATTEKLYAMEATPPQAAWQAISRSLYAEKEAAIPAHKRFSPFWRYAAAAAIAGIMIWAGSQFLFKQKDAAETVAVTTPVLNDNNNTAPLPHSEQALADAEAAIEEARNDAALEESKQVYASVDVSSLQKKAKKYVRPYSGNTDYQAAGGTRGGVTDEDTYYEPPIDADNYVVLMTPDGKFVRMSKKLGEFVCCVAGEEQDKNCIDEMSRLREKMVNRPLAHSPGNFLELVNLVNSLDEN